MRILTLHKDYFGDLWRSAGHEVVTCGDRATDGLRLAGYFVTIEEILAALGPSRAPDVIFWGDDSRLVRILGLERCPIPAVMWSIDTHHHASWHSLLAQAFDRVLVAQSDYLPAFRTAGIATLWLPLFSSPDFPRRTEVAAAHEVSFVGTQNHSRNPDRIRFLTELRRRVRLYTAEGPYADVYRHSKIVLNQTVKGDLNFRVFEAMGCGSLLLTERTTNGLQDLFQDGVHLVTYPRGDVPAAAALIARYLENSDVSERIAAAGWAETRRRHLRSHRAAFLLDVFADVIAAQDASRPCTGKAIDLEMSLMYLHLSHRAQASAVRVAREDPPGAGMTANRRRRRARASQYLHLARDYLHAAGTHDARDDARQQIARLIDTFYASVVANNDPLPSHDAGNKIDG